MFSDDDGSEESWSTVQDSSSEPPSPASTVKYSSDDSGSTVEVEVSKSPVYRMTLRSHSKKSVSPEPTPDPTEETMPSQNINVSADTPAANTPNPPAGKSKRPKKDKGKSRKKKAPTFHQPIQCTFRRDNVDEECRRLKIMYRRWPGMMEPKDHLHKSHCQFSDNEDGYFPVNQRIPGDCVICPMQKYLENNWDKRCHYRTKHQEQLFVLDDIVMLQCKCSAVRSCGWDRDKSSRNAHFHCSICHWLRNKPSQLVNHIHAIHGRAANTLHHLAKGKSSDWFVKSF